MFRLILIFIFMLACLNPATADNKTFDRGLCMKAGSYCIDDCRANKVIANQNGMYALEPERYDAAETTFAKDCEDACGAGTKQCNDRNNGGCYQFKEICNKSCPQTYTDAVDGTELANSDGQIRCLWACDAGFMACLGREKESVCSRGENSCNERCGDAQEAIDDAAYNTCLDACRYGSGQCEGRNMDCEAFNYDCWNKCPESYGSYDTGYFCQVACQKGAESCHSKQDHTYE